MKLSDYIIDFLAKDGITHIFEVAGGSITHLLDSLHENKNVVAISMHHEQAAAMAAEGFSRVSGNYGVALATSGPGATNLITGIGSCFFDSIPCLFITGQVNTYEFKFEKPIRQLGFQETDIVKIVQPIVKDSVLITEASNIKKVLQKSIFCLKSQRPGPVLLDIPMNIQRANIDEELIESFDPISQQKSTNLPSEMLDGIVQLIASAKRPLLLVGGGGRLANANNLLYNFVERTRIPVVCSLMGLDMFPHDHPLFAGMIGTYGNRYANLAVANADFILALGTRLDTRQTGTKPETFARAAKIVRVDIDSDELSSSKIKVSFSVNYDARLFLEKILENFESFSGCNIQPWIETINNYKKAYPSFTLPKDESIEPNYFIHKLSEAAPPNSVVCVDIGQNQMWAAQSFKVKKDMRFLTEGGMAAMGSALPMAIGAAFAKPERPIIVITGDGGFQLNIHELETVYHHKLPIKIIMLNNKCYGMIRQFQEQYFNSRYQSTVYGYSSPCFQEVVSAYKIPSEKIAKSSEIVDALKKIFSDRNPAFLEVNIDSKYKALPKLSVDKPVEDQEPLLSRDELRSRMII